MKKLLITVALATCFASGAFAQAKPATPADPALTACRVGLNTEYTALVRDHAEGVKAGKMSKTEEADYQKTLAALKTKWVEAMKDGASLKECTDQRAAIKKANAELNEMQAVNGKVHVCFSEFKTVSAASDKIIADGIQSKAVDAKEAAEYKTRDAALQRQYDVALKSGKVTQKECDGLLASAKAENALALKMADVKSVAAKPAAAASAPADLAACRADLDKQYRALLADHDADKKNINPAEEKNYQATLAKLKSDWAAASKDGASLDECKAQITKIQSAQRDLNRMQSTPSIRPTPRPQ